MSSPFRIGLLVTLVIVAVPLFGWLGESDVDNDEAISVTRLSASSTPEIGSRRVAFPTMVPSSKNRR